MGMMRFNFLHPPFNNQKMRQALLYVVDQKDYVLGIAGDPKNWPYLLFATSPAARRFRPRSAPSR